MLWFWSCRTQRCVLSRCLRLSRQLVVIPCRINLQTVGLSSCRACINNGSLTTSRSYLVRSQGLAPGWRTPASSCKSYTYAGYLNARSFARSLCCYETLIARAASDDAFYANAPRWAALTARAFTLLQQAGGYIGGGSSLAPPCRAGSHTFHFGVRRAGF